MGDISVQDVKGARDKNDSVFEGLVEEKDKVLGIDTQLAQVSTGQEDSTPVVVPAAVVEETPESTTSVPETGVFGVTVGLFTLIASAIL